MEQLRKLRVGEFSKVAEYVDRSRFLSKTFEKPWTKDLVVNFENRLRSSDLAQDQLKTVMKCGLLTYLLHCEARLASYVGQGFYTIGPCGEELLGFSTLNMKEQDLTALHYRHSANSIVRQLLENKSVSDIALDRARGFTVSSLDPVTGGRHCSIGGDFNREFLVTSTLASQAPSAVGRALAIPLSNRLLGKNAKFASDAVSYVSLGDGSVNNAHFIAALNLARYSEHGGIKCPTVFVVSDNRVCISLKGNGYIDKFYSQLQGVMHTQNANGQDFLDIYQKSKQAIDYSRSKGRPSFLLVSNLPRRFGHAATDRQTAYFTADEVQAQVDKDPLSETFSLMLQLGIYSKAELENLFQSLHTEVEQAFNVASLEPKIKSRESLVSTNSQPFNNAGVKITSEPTMRLLQKRDKTGERPDVMRKHMTRVFDEILGSDNSVVYIGEDVQHGGYYLVTDGLHKKYPMRVRDFPPDETTLVGAAIGFSQSGLTPILEIPYSKYLDCGADMFYEAIISNWLSNGKQPNGMVIRLQGFDKGIFGGNFHTHNMLNFPPGLDVVCFSNGYDYARGMKYLKQQAKAGRVVMSVDSTDLLNRRHLVDDNKDEFMLSNYPAESESYHFDEVIVYTPRNTTNGATKPKIVIVTYGNGVPTSLQAQNKLEEQYPEHEVVVIETPCLSQTPSQLVDYCQKNTVDRIVFADVCKQGPGMPMTSRLTDLQAKNALKTSHWRVVGACPTYNPLGTYLTFLSVDDIVSAFDAMK